MKFNAEGGKARKHFFSGGGGLRIYENQDSMPVIIFICNDSVEARMNPHLQKVILSFAQKFFGWKPL